MRNNILIITESMMPFTDSWGSCQRVFHYAKTMTANGYSVSVICKNARRCTEDHTEIVASIRVTGIGGVSSSNHSRGSSYGVKCFLKNVYKNNAFASKIMKFGARVLYSEPNLSFGSKTKKWADCSIKLIEKYIHENNIDIVIISGPPFGMFRYAEQIKETGIKLILDYRDPWTLWYEKRTFASRIEKKAIRCADLVVASTQSLADALNKEYRISYCHPILNGYDESTWKDIVREEPARGTLTISYIGAVWIEHSPDFRDPKIFINAANDFLMGKDDVVIQMIGVRDDIDQITAKYGNRIKYKNNISVAESLVEMMKSNVLIVFHTAKDSSGKYIVCGKLYDYLRSDRYILSIGDHAEVNNMLIKKYSAGAACKNSVEDIKDALNQIYSLWKENENTQINFHDDTLSREYQNQLFIDLIRKSLNEN